MAKETKSITDPKELLDETAAGGLYVRVKGDAPLVGVVAKPEWLRMANRWEKDEYRLTVWLLPEDREPKDVLGNAEFERTLAMPKRAAHALAEAFLQDGGKLKAGSIVVMRRHGSGFETTYKAAVVHDPSEIDTAKAAVS